MRFLVPIFVFVTVAAFQSAFSASLESAEKEEAVAQHDGLTELQKIDQMEFEAAQKNEAAHTNVTEEQSEDVSCLEAVQDGSVEEHVEAEGDSTESESSEEADGRQRRDHHEATTSVDGFSQGSTTQQDVLE